MHVNFLIRVLCYHCFNCSKNTSKKL